MNQRISYVLSEYYKHYEPVRGYPHILSQRMGETCQDDVDDHSSCCALEKKYFLYLCRLIDVYDEHYIEFLLCPKRKVAGNDGIRDGNVEKPQNMGVKDEWFIKLSVMSIFTIQFGHNPQLLVSLINILKKTDLANDCLAKEFIDKYFETGNHFSCNTELGIMIAQTFGLYKEKGDKIIRFTNIVEIEKYFNDHLESRYGKNRKKSTYAYITCA